jgi:hypothetical protein
MKKGRRMKILSLFVAVLGMIHLATATAWANPYEDAAHAIAKERIQPWLHNAKIITAIKAQNAAHAALSPADVTALDQKWRNGDSTFIDGVLNNALSQYLQSIRDESAGLFTEIFVMDNKGLNVGQSDKTSDYWQGDEAKWQKTYLVGANAMHLSEITEDESTQTFQMQISLPIADQGTVIGAITVGINAEALTE